MAVGVLRNMSPALTLTDVEFRMAEATPGAAGAGGSAPGVPGPMGTRGLAADEVSVE
jgi:hypothetical protein